MRYNRLRTCSRIRLMVRSATSSLYDGGVSYRRPFRAETPARSAIASGGAGLKAPRRPRLARARSGGFWRKMGLPLPHRPKPHLFSSNGPCGVAGRRVPPPLGGGGLGQGGGKEGGAHSGRKP